MAKDADLKAKERESLPEELKETPEAPAVVERAREKEKKAAESSTPKRSSKKPPSDDADTYRVRSNVLLYRNRGLSSNYDLLAGEREDLLRRTPEGWQIASRRIVLDQIVIASRNLSFFL